MPLAVKGEFVLEDNLSVGITAFIDILGFGEKILNAESFDDIKIIKQEIEQIQKEFDFESKDEQISELQKSHKKTVLAFSDCVIINVPLQSEATEYSGTFDPLMNELVGFAYTQGSCVLNSIFLRGGVETGWWLQEGSTLMSQSLVDSVKRESSADVPVIALCETIYKYFSDHDHRKFYSEDDDPIKSMFREYKTDDDSFFYIDYISICLRSLDWHRSRSQLNKYQASSPEEKDEIVTSGHRDNVDDWLCEHARNIEEAYKIAPNKKVKYKYQWLSNYHNEISEKYSTNTSCQCKV